MLAVSWNLARISLGRLPSGDFAERLWNPTLDCVKKKVNVFTACQILSVLHDQSDSFIVLLVSFVRID